MATVKETVNETFKDVVEKLEKDIARHKEYINAAPSLNYKRYVAVIHIVEPVTGFVEKIRLGQLVLPHTGSN